MSIVVGVGMLPVIWMLATDRWDLTTKKEKAIYKAEGRKIANKLNAVFLTMIALTVTVFGAMLLLERYDLLMYIIPALAVEALGPMGVWVYMNAKWRK